MKTSHELLRDVKTKKSIWKIQKLRKKGLSLRKISSLLKEEYGYTVSFVSVGNILKDISWMKKEKRRMNNKKKTSKTTV